ncbi:MAG: sigma 54-interacting transcriptional regulator, partial [Desulfobacterales bacterium]
MIMAGKSILSALQRRFFQRVSRAVFTNPFSAERDELDLQISGLSPKTPQATRMTAVISAVGVALKDLDHPSPAALADFSGEDQRLVRNVLLFDFFHRFMAPFDELIQDQMSGDGPPLKVAFAQEAFRYLGRRGFSDAEIQRYFEFCFQLRRAYFFIDQNLVGRSSCMRELRRKLWNNVFTHDLDLYQRYLWNRMEDFSTLLLGATGTGKGTAATAIGRSGLIPYDPAKGRFVESFTRSFIALNLSQFSEALIESELFGHKKGAFTGASEDFQGVLSRCSPHGAIFLDEIGEVSEPVQIKLLQVLQERTFTPVGSHQIQRFKGRVIAATNRGPTEISRPGGLRDDFYYRLCSDIITIPPLQRRIQEDPGELDDLLALLIQRLLGQPSPELTVWVRRHIEEQLGLGYAWPGNVRELAQCVRRLLLNRRYTPRSAQADPDLAARL